MKHNTDIYSYPGYQYFYKGVQFKVAKASGKHPWFIDCEILSERNNSEQFYSKKASCEFCKAHIDDFIKNSQK